MAVLVREGVDSMDGVLEMYDRDAVCL